MPENDDKKPGFLAGLNKAINDISAEIKNDMRESPADAAAARAASDRQMAKAVGEARSGVAFVESKDDFHGTGHVPPPPPLMPTSAAARALNPWPTLREPGSFKNFLTDAYYHAYTPADLEHYVSSLPTSVPRVVSIICAEAGDEGLLEAFNDTLKGQSGLFGATGFSPRNMQADLQAMDDKLTDLLNNNPKLLAVGPIGLDLTYTSHNLAQQAAQMAKQLEIAYDFDLPALVFQNGALTELRDILEQGISLPQKLIWLKPIQSDEELALIEEYNFYVAFRAELTWPKETFYRDVAKKVLPQRWLVGAGNSLKSTHNRAGQFNCSAGLEEIIATLAELKGMEIPQLKERLNMNFAQVYGPSEGTKS